MQYSVSPPLDARIGLVGDIQSQTWPWPLAWQLSSLGDVRHALQAAQPPGGASVAVILFDARGLADPLARFATLREASHGDIPLVVLRVAPEADDAQWWSAGAFDCCDPHDLPCLERTVAHAIAAATSAHGTLARLRRLHREQQALQASLDNIPAPIFVKDDQGIYIECNLAFQDYLGLRREQIIGKTIYDVAPPELAQVYEQADRRLLAEGGRQIYEAQVRWADGSKRDVMFHKAVWCDADGRRAGQAGAMFDITERKQLEQQLRQQAETDPLTGLLNRRAFMDLAHRALSDARDSGQPIALMLIDIDHFKQINDTRGHAAGDHVLRHLAELLSTQMRPDDVLARLGGDEFALVLLGRQDARTVAAQLPGLVACGTLSFNDIPLIVTISLGAALVHPAQHSADSALQLADLALYEAKQRGRNRTHVIED